MKFSRAKNENTIYGRLLRPADLDRPSSFVAKAPAFPAWVVSDTPVSRSIRCSIGAAALPGLASREQKAMNYCPRKWEMHFMPSPTNCEPGYGQGPKLKSGNILGNMEYKSNTGIASSRIDCSHHKSPAAFLSVCARRAQRRRTFLLCASRALSRLHSR